MRIIKRAFGALNNARFKVQISTVQGQTRRANPLGMPLSATAYRPGTPDNSEPGTLNFEQRARCARCVDFTGGF